MRRLFAVLLLFMVWTGTFLAQTPVSPSTSIDIPAPPVLQSINSDTYKGALADAVVSRDVCTANLTEVERYVATLRAKIAELSNQLSKQNAPSSK